MIKEGLKHTSRLVVSEANSAKAMGSGDLPVLATPAMIALMENAAMLAVANELEETQTTVGGRMETTHQKPSAIGAEITATAELTKVEGRKLFFTVRAEQEETLIGEGTHLRFIVNRDKFMGNI